MRTKCPSRRHFLISVGAGAAAAVVSPLAQQSASAGDRRSADSVRRDLEKLVDGRIMGADDAGYSAAVAIDNGRVRRAPLLVVAPSSRKDIAATVKYCNRHSIRLTTKS